MISMRSRGSIAARLTRMNVLVGATALLLAFVSFLSLDLFSYRQNIIAELRTQAQILGANSASALFFDDSQAAQTTVSALRSSPYVLSAVLCSSSGQPFAEYRRDNNSAIADTPQWSAAAPSSVWTRGSNILLGERVVSDGKPLGTIYILSATTEIGQRARLYTLMAIAILLLCLLLALLVTSRFRHVIAEPLMNLAETARVVSSHKDYTVRARPLATNDEFALLVESFNEMLGEIQARDEALMQSKHQLEARVQERTAELMEANKELEAFSYSVAHDLRGPLETIGNLSYLIKNSAAGKVDGETEEMLDEIPRTATRMSGLVGDLLTLSRSKNAELHREPIDLSEIARAVEHELRIGDPGRGTEFRIVPEARVLADRGLMQIVLYNLLCNAWKYSSKAGDPLIEFGYREEEGRRIFFVRDNGAGFDEMLADDLFKPFERLHAQSDFSGTGVGLATVRRIVSRHGGEIWATGHVGRGATFFFTLPER